MIALRISLLSLLLISATLSAMKPAQPKKNIEKLDDVLDFVRKEHSQAIDDSTSKTPYECPKSYLDPNAKRPTNDEYWRDFIEHQLYRPRSEQFVAACNLLDGFQSSPQKYLEMDIKTLHDLKIIKGGDENEESRKQCLANKINRTALYAGEVALCLHLVRPFASHKDLSMQGNKISFLRNHPELAQKLETQLRNAATGEDGFLSLFTPYDHIEIGLMRKAKNSSVFDKIGWYKRLKEWSEDNPIMLTLEEGVPVLSCAGRVLYTLSKVLTGLGKGSLQGCLSFFSEIGFEWSSENPILFVGKVAAPKTLAKLLGVVGFAQKVVECGDNIKQTYDGIGMIALPASNICEKNFIMPVNLLVL